MNSEGPKALSRFMEQREVTIRNIYWGAIGGRNQQSTTQPPLSSPSPWLNIRGDCVCVCVCGHSVVSDSLQTPWTTAHQVPLSMGFPRQEYWSGLPFPTPGHLLDSGIKPRLSCLLPQQAEYLPRLLTWLMNGTAGPGTRPPNTGTQSTFIEWLLGSAWCHLLR